MARYNFRAVEKKWQEIWEEKQIFKTSNDFSKPKYYALVEFPYPSGEGLHVGHPRPYTALDVVARKRRLEGYNVLFPMGWDAFGLPTENYAIQTKIHPAVITERNINRFREQLKSLGFSFDWSREVNTTDPAYFKWTQWIFLKLFEHGLAYKKEMPINWCPRCKIGLANEEVVDGKCERCSHQVETRVKNQWMLKITAYAERLINDLELVDYIERVKVQQRNWIGRSEGADVIFKIKDTEETLTVFTTRPDTLFGATYMVISPEHPVLEKLKDRITNVPEIAAYQEQARKKSEFERSQLVREKTGVPVEGLKAINPVNGMEIPIWVSDYVLMTYGTGAIMAVPGHDQRDWEFAVKFGLPIVEVVAGGDITKEAYTDIDEGVMVNSGFLDGLDVKSAQKKIIAWLQEKGLGVPKVNYKLRDWVFSRQRYWGEPIPLVHCEKCGWVPVPEEELPVRLPQVANYEPTDTGESPLAKIRHWVETTCPKCGGYAERETDTMPQWAGSSWYFLRYCDPHNDQALASKEALDYWLPVDWYNGGMEHTTLHLLYSRFWHKFLYDIGVVPGPEPYAKRTSHGMILGENNEKMSKSRGNVINPDDVVAEYGADTLRLYEMFIGDFEKSVPWSTEGVRGCKRFLDRVWKLMDMVIPGEAYRPELEAKMHQTIKKVSQDYESLKFNTAIAALMTLLNDVYHTGSINEAELKTFLILLNPVAPHITEEIWERLKFGGMLNEQSWPTWDEAKTVEKTVEIGVQVNGKLRGTIEVNVDDPQEAAREKALANEAVQRALDGKTIVKEIYVPGRIYNIVVK
ncbi:MAG: leucine--tRNA ligase [Limnochordia bacterium]|jgi:leucyl-tRNA synthetase|nr:leucine--tRNA ligase [Limnochordia bacterium]MDI9464147.1 leucine--tRNA ligase [Bacillota bacterium]NLO95804.1 leucine--tRNA ligase [Bacillota bacterium]HAN94807.1 leucine--tRNA ligase [Bacillota bacterium]HOB41491.1 leucine--tRNA ligase [Limnochordia bacterium]